MKSEQAEAYINAHVCGYPIDGYITHEDAECACEIAEQEAEERGAGFLGDMEKYNTATCLGWRVVRCTPEQLLTTNTLQMIKKLISTTSSVAK